MTKKCVRCGRRIFNPSTICFKCNKEFQTYMKTHPLKYLNTPYYPTIFKMNKKERGEFDEMAKAETEKRWKNFISEQVQFT